MYRRSILMDPRYAYPGNSHLSMSSSCTLTAPDPTSLGCNKLSLSSGPLEACDSPIMLFYAMHGKV